MYEGNPLAMTLVAMVTTTHFLGANGFISGFRPVVGETNVDRVERAHLSQVFTDSAQQNRVSEIFEALNDHSIGNLKYSPSVLYISVHLVQLHQFDNYDGDDVNIPMTNIGHRY